MRYAIFSDIHNHTTALQSILHHAVRQGVDGYFCLGDVGIDECVDLVRNVAAPTVFGNWEVSGWRYLSPENRDWAFTLPPVRRTARFWLTHAAPLWPDELATLADLNADRHSVSMSRLFPYLHHESEALWDSIALLAEADIPLMFHGHTHRQLAWRFGGNNHLERLHPRLITLQPGETWLIGVGSVGSPMDGPDPSYVIYDDQARRVEMLRVNDRLA
jgi:predicted phosphodiesterase